jgi:hypothetical protein
MAMVGVGIASAAATDTASTSATAPVVKQFNNPIKNLPADVQAALKTAMQAKDFTKVEQILKGNGVTMPTRMGKRAENGADREAIKNLPQAVKDELKTAREAKDFTKIEQIMKDNGITMPTAMNKRVEKGVRAQAMKNLPQAVKDELSAARKAKDYTKVQQILKDNGISVKAPAAATPVANQ